MEVASLIAAVIAGIAAMFGVFANNRQADLAAGQLRVMQQQLNDARDAAEASAKDEAMSVARQRQLLHANKTLADATKSQADTSKDTERRQLRAYIAAYPRTIQNLAAGKMPTWGVVIRAGGLTPAYNVAVRVRVMLAKYPYSDDLTATLPLEPQKADNRGTIFPSDSGTYVDDTLRCYPNSPQGIQCPLSQADFEAVKKSEAVRLVVFGILTYDDAFGAHHHTPFCYNYVGADDQSQRCAVVRNPD